MESKKQGRNTLNSFTLEVMPGICGFTCTVHATSIAKRNARIKICGSECAMIQELSTRITEISMQDIFTPLTKNRIFQGAERAGCHLACPVPVAVVNTAEVALALPLPQNVK